MGKLSIAYKPEDIWHGELSVVVETREFACQGAAWFNVTQIQHFSDALNRVPIEEGSEPMLEGGIWRMDVLEQPFVAIKLVQHNLTGAVRVECSLATPIHLHGTQSTFCNSCRVYLFTTYGDLHRFHMSLNALARGEQAYAELRVDEGPNTSFSG